MNSSPWIDELPSFRAPDAIRLKRDFETRRLRHMPVPPRQTIPVTRPLPDAVPEMKVDVAQDAKFATGSPEKLASSVALLALLMSSR